MVTANGLNSDISKGKVRRAGQNLAHNSDNSDTSWIGVTDATNGQRRFQVFFHCLLAMKEAGIVGTDAGQRTAHITQVRFGLAYQ
jgi:hypothetical protein